MSKSTSANPSFPTAALSRRHFLLWSGALAGLAALPAASQRAYAAAGRPQRETVGLRGSIPGQLAQVLDVKSFGATGDGTTDDRTAILDAIAAIPPDDLNTSILYFPPGIYISSGPIYIAGKNNFLVLGHGATIRIQDGTAYVADLAQYPRAYEPSATREFSVFEIFNCSKWILAGLILDGNYANRGPSVLEHSHGLHLAGCHRFTVQSLETQYCQGDGIVLTAINNPAFPGAGERASNCSDFAALDIQAHNIARNSISFVGARKGVVDGLIDYEIGTDLDNSASTGPWSGLHFEVDPGEESYQVAERITATNLDMRAHRPDNGIPNGGSGGAIRFSNQARRCTVSGFYYQQDTENNQIQYIVRVGPNCDQIRVSTGTVLVSNAAPSRSTPSYGVYLDEGAARVTIEHVNIDGPTIGMRVSAGGRRNRIKSNVVRNTYSHALLLTGACHVSDNYLLDITGNGEGGFIQAQGREAIECENNVLCFALPGLPPAAYFWLSVNTTNFSAKYNKCCGILGSPNIFETTPKLFLGNEFF